MWRWTWTRRRTLLFVVFCGACLCFLPWILDWSKSANDNAIVTFLRKLSDDWQNSGYYQSTVSDKRVPPLSRANVLATAHSNLTRLHTTPVSTSNLKSRTAEQTREERVTIIVGLGITSVGLTDITPGSLRSKFAFFRDLLPTFCKTASGGYHYGFYLAHDHNDTFFGQEGNAEHFQEGFSTGGRADLCR